MGKRTRREPWPGTPSRPRPPHTCLEADRESYALGCCEESASRTRLIGYSAGRIPSDPRKPWVLLAFAHGCRLGRLLTTARTRVGNARAVFLHSARSARSGAEEDPDMTSAAPGAGREAVENRPRHRSRPESLPPAPPRIPQVGSPELERGVGPRLGAPSRPRPPHTFVATKAPAGPAPHGRRARRTPPLLSILVALALVPSPVRAEADPVLDCARGGGVLAPG